MGKKVFISENKTKEVLIDMFTEYFGEDLRGVITERINNSTQIFFKNFKFSKDNNLFYKAKVDSIEKKVFKSKRKRCFVNVEKKSNIMENFSLSGCCFNKCETDFNFTEKNPKLQYHNFIVIDKSDSLNLDEKILHEFLHVISAEMQLNTNENRLELNRRNGFDVMKVEYEWDTEGKKWEYARTYTRTGIGLNEFLTEMTALTIKEGMTKKGQTFARKFEEQEDLCSYLVMKHIGSDLFTHFGKQLYRYAITDDFSEVSSFINERELKEIIARFDYFYKNYKFLFDDKMPEEIATTFKKNFEASNMQLIKLIQYIIKRNTRKKEVQSKPKQSEGIYLEC